MFETLEEQIRTDELKATTKRQRMFEYAAIVVISLILFGALYLGIHLLAG